MTKLHGSSENKQSFLFFDGRYLGYMSAHILSVMQHTLSISLKLKSKPELNGLVSFLVVLVQL